jgi:exosortase/archaeosortase family protein
MHHIIDKLSLLRNVLRFIIITSVIHVLWRLWEYQLDYFPVAEAMQNVSMLLVRIITSQSGWIVKHFFDNEVSNTGQIIYLGSYRHLEIFEGCSGLKQFAQFGILILLCPGKWYNKIWFIPSGIILIHITNIVRMVGLSMVIMNCPEYWEFTHNFLFKWLFYAVIFSLWVFWTDYLPVIRVQNRSVLFHCYPKT